MHTRQLNKISTLRVCIDFHKTVFLQFDSFCLNEHFADKLIEETINYFKN